MIKDKYSKYYRSLSWNLILTAIAVSFTPLIMVIGVLLYQFNVSYQEKTQAHLSELVQKHAQNIDTFLTEKLANLRQTSVNNSIESLSNSEVLREKLQNLRSEYSNVFVDLGVVDDRGMQLAYAGPYELKNVTYADADWFKAALQLDMYISDVFTGLRGHPHFIVAVKKHESGRNILLRATIDFKAFNSLVQNLKIGKTGYAYILNRKGEFQTSPPLEYKASPTGYEFFWNAVAKTKNTFIITQRKDESGTENLYAVASLKDGQWLLIVKQQVKDAFSDLNRMQNIAVIIFIIGGIAILMMVYYTTRRMVRRIRRADKEKEFMNQQVIETGKMASIGELAAGIAHEINNPVAIMVEEAGWIGDLLEEEEFAQSSNLEEFNRALKQINTQGRRCKEITHKLLSFARKTDSTVKDVQLNEIITEIVGISSQMAKYNKVTIEMNLQPTLPYITISPSEMQQVLLNLINNALDAMEKTGGTIQISTKISEIEPGHIVIIIQDDGPGIPEANLARVFDPFFTTKPVGKGTGLGLSICYGIINKMGGKIDVQSASGQGARFRIWIPVQK
ncbi:MAG: sensor histidine kinase [Desulfobacteraceae bacterium]|nr:MAG: sensor histidine kinase [Desulfobacteraceae bacterium]